MSMSTTNRIKTLYNCDGIVVTAAILNESDSLPDDASAESGIILTLYINRHYEKNVINPGCISSIASALDVIENHELCSDSNNKSLIITGMYPPSNSEMVEMATSANAKFFSNGLDLQWFTSASPISRPTMIENFNSQVLARILTLPFRTVAAINGHCIGAGLFIALACDYRFMRSERGYVQWPEARLGMRLTKGFAELTKAKISSHSVLREGVLGAKKYTPEEALNSGIVDSVVAVEKLYLSAFQCAVKGLPEKLGLDSFDPKAFSEVKIEMFTDAYRALKFGKVEDSPHSRI